MPKGVYKCSTCSEWGKWKYKKKSKRFCTKEHKQEYYDNHIPTLKKDIQEEFNAMVTKDRPCARCGKSFEKMDCSHVYTRGAYDNLRYDIFNVLPMCSRDHNFWWHKEPMEAFTWFKAYYPERFEYLQFAKNQSRKWTADELKQIRRDIKERNVEGLVRFKDEYEWMVEEEHKN